MGSLPGLSSILMDRAKIKISNEIFRPDLPDLTGWRKREERKEYSIFCRPALRVNATLDLGFASVVDPPNPRPNAASAIYYLPNDLSFAHHPRVALCVPLGSKYRGGLSSRDIPSTTLRRFPPDDDFRATPSPVTRSGYKKLRGGSDSPYKYFYLPHDASIWSFENLPRCLRFAKIRFSYFAGYSKEGLSYCDKYWKLISSCFQIG